jgi:hypothetical protein
VNRYYSSIWGRFLSPDPSLSSNALVIPENWNKYAYVGGDPINKTDPFGLCSPNDDPPCYSVTLTEFLTGAGGGAGEGGNGYIYIPTPWDKLDMSKSQYLRFLGQEMTALGRLLSNSTNRLKSDLAKPDCAKDFKDANKDISKLGSTGYKNYGAVTETTGADGSLQVIGSVLARYSPVTGIYLNSAINWSVPNDTTAIISGEKGTYPALAAEAAYINVPTLTTSQFMDLIILHELSHYNGTIGDPDKGPRVEQKLYKDCIK